MRVQQSFELHGRLTQPGMVGGRAGEAQELVAPRGSGTLALASG